MLQPNGNVNMFVITIPQQQEISQQFRFVYLLVILFSYLSKREVLRSFQK
jgi:hypothetical protein